MCYLRRCNCQCNEICLLFSKIKNCSTYHYVKIWRACVLLLLSQLIWALACRCQCKLCWLIRVTSLLSISHNHDLLLIINIALSNDDEFWNIFYVNWLSIILWCKQGNRIPKNKLRYLWFTILCDTTLHQGVSSLIAYSNHSRHNIVTYF